MVKYQVQDIFRFCQRLLRGAAGKDREGCEQLRGQLLKVQVAYDHLQQKYDHQKQECDRISYRCQQFKASQQQLQQEHQYLQQQHMQLQQAQAILERDRDDQKAYFNHAAKENAALQAEKEHLIEELDRLQQMLRQGELETERIANHRGRLIGRVAFLEQKLDLQHYQGNHSAAGALSTEKTIAEKHLALDPEDALNSKLDSGLSYQPDLTGLSIAIVGAHETSFNELQTELKQRGLKRCIHILPHSQESSSRQQIEDKISGCHLVVVVTSYLDHTVSRCVKQLDKLGRLSGQVMWACCHGKSGLLREIFQHFDQVAENMDR